MVREEFWREEFLSFLHVTGSGPLSFTGLPRQDRQYGWLLDRKLVKQGDCERDLLYQEAAHMTLDHGLLPADSCPLAATRRHPLSGLTSLFPKERRDTSLHSGGSSREVILSNKFRVEAGTGASRHSHICDMSRLNLFTQN